MINVFGNENFSAWLGNFVQNNKLMNFLYILKSSCVTNIYN